jgi:WD40 repeat protein
MEGLSCLVNECSTLETDSIECNPTSENFRFVVMGKYHLDESSATRVGGISLLELDFLYDDRFDLKERSFISRAGVLDSKWNPSGTKVITSEADGHTGLFSFKEDNSLEFSGEYLYSSGIGLAVDRNAVHQNLILSSFSDGQILLFDLESQFGEPLQQINAHPSAEVWAAAFSKFSSNIIYSGKNSSIIITHTQVLTGQKFRWGRLRIKILGYSRKSCTNTCNKTVNTSLSLECFTRIQKPKS